MAVDQSEKKKNAKNKTKQNSYIQTLKADSC